MPPKTTVPSELRAALPAPVANTSGVTPRKNAIEVIKIGRNRVSAACRAASRNRLAGGAQLVCELNDQDRVLARETDQHHVADLRKHVGDDESRDSQSPESAPKSPSGTAIRMMSGSAKNLVLRRQDEKDEHDAERKDQDAAWLPPWISLRARVPVHS